MEAIRRAAVVTRLTVYSLQDYECMLRQSVPCGRVLSRRGIQREVRLSAFCLARQLHGK
jgi:hypothetical protein